MEVMAISHVPPDACQAKLKIKCRLTYMPVNAPPLVSDEMLSELAFPLITLELLSEMTFLAMDLIPTLNQLE